MADQVFLSLAPLTQHCALAICNVVAGEREFTKITQAMLRPVALDCQLCPALSSACQVVIRQIQPRKYTRANARAAFALASRDRQEDSVFIARLVAAAPVVVTI